MIKERSSPHDMLKSLYWLEKNAGFEARTVT